MYLASSSMGGAVVCSVVLGCACALVGLMPMHDSRCDHVSDWNSSIAMLSNQFSCLYDITFTYIRSLSPQPLLCHTLSCGVEGAWLHAWHSEWVVAACVDVPAHHGTPPLHQHRPCRPGHHDCSTCVWVRLISLHSCTIVEWNISLFDCSNVFQRFYPIYQLFE